MKGFIAGLVGAAAVLVGVSQTVADSIAVTATADPLWTYTGIQLTSSDTITISGATGSWSPWTQWQWFGPDGYPDYPYYAYDEWFVDSQYQHGQLIGYIGETKPNYTFPQNAPGMFDIGSATVTLSGVSGYLWLGYNDDFSSHLVDDNGGSVDVQIGGTYSLSPEPPYSDYPGGTTPEPSTIVLLGIGAVSMMAYAWRKRRRTA